MIKLRRLLPAVALLCVFAGCRSVNKATVPDHLVGVWKSAAEKYADRFLKITAYTIVFGTGKGRGDGYPIGAITSEYEGGAWLYEISFFTPENEKQTLSFYYHETIGGGEIRLANQREIIWTKESG